MIYMGDANWWNNRFSARSDKLMAHDSKLEADMAVFPNHGTALDIACGDGRNSIFLSKHGYSVDAVDFSETALERLHSFANAEKQIIHTKFIDLSNDSAFDELKEYDLIIINHFRLNKSLYPDLLKHLKKDGYLWVNGFHEIPSNNPNVTNTDLLIDGDFEKITNCSLQNKELYINGEHKLVRYIWKKNKVEGDQ
ncbi:MAG: methyltransferase domain-containing protein [Butyrivibrio sp.]|nr:methyltransferase domain-containing protein [Butyrivibrio sp.]